VSGPAGVTDPPPVPADPPPVPADPPGDNSRKFHDHGGGRVPGQHRALRPDALPSDTAVRFLLLILAVVAASLYFFQALWFVLRRERFDDSWRACGATAGELAGGLVGTTSSELQRMAACRADMTREQAAFTIAGSLLVLAAAWAAYRLLPFWREHRRRLVPVDPRDGQALLDEVAAISAQAGLARPPAVRLDAANPGVQAYVYGGGGDLRVGMTGGLVVQRLLDPPGFRAVLRHELAHVANRDVPWTYYTVAVWWSFLGLALVPVVVVFLFANPTYVLRLGWRSLLLALLVALVAASVLRAREAFADARSVEWGPSADLDRVLAAQPASRGRRPQQLRVHPLASERRALLADPDRLFRADWFTALATGVAGGTALVSVQAIVDLALPSMALVVSVLVVAPLVAGVLCVTAWRVGLREAVRGGRQPLGLPLGPGLGAGLAVAPVLSIDAAQGGVGGPGYVLWALAMMLVTILVVRWVVDAARVRVASAVNLADPRRALAGHVVAGTLVMALLLACGHYALLLLTSNGPSVLSQSQVWLWLPSVSISFWLGLAPVLAAAAMVAVPWLARRDLARSTPGTTAGWLWRDGNRGPAEHVDSLRSSRPRLRPIVGIGLAAGATAAAAMAGARLLMPLLSDQVRGSDALAVALASATEGSVIAAVVAASVAAAVALPVRWWPLAFVAGGVATVVTGFAAIVVIVAAGCGLLPSVRPDCSAPGWALVKLVLTSPATAAVPVAFLLIATVAVGRSLAGVRASGSAASVRADVRSAQRLGRRAGLAALAVAVAAGIWSGALNLRVLAVNVPLVSGPEYVVELPAVWRGQADPATGETVFVTVAEDVRVVVRPRAAAAPPTTGEWVDVGGRRAFLIGTEQQGGVQVHAYDVQGPAAVYRIFVVGTPSSLGQRREELAGLLGALRWTAR
jgi:Zn-dependent protease with chaperone function